jgi:hypothetical protein
MRKMMMASAFLVGTLLCIGQHAIAAESTCRTFSTSGWDDEQGYANCAQCLRQNQSCETRCFNTYFICTAVGYDHYGFRSTIQGPTKYKQQRARKQALRQCEQQGLTGCSVTRCTEKKSLQPESIEVCRSQPTGLIDSYMGWADNTNRGNNREPEYRCGIFPTSPQAPQREYPNCNACVKKHGQCEERCAESGYICTATGYTRYGLPETIQGKPARNPQKAEGKAMRKCYEAGLNGCIIDQCRETMRFDSNQTTLCKTQVKKNRNKEKNLPPHQPYHHQPHHQPHPQQTQKYVTSWQHLKGRCEGPSYHKVAQQCGNRGYWHGIYCRVTWSDGSTQNLHGKVDLRDPYGRAYCTRNSRPARFNCVGRCDNTNGRLMKLPRP